MPSDHDASQHRSPPAAQPRGRGASANNPVRIGRIGSDDLQVHIRAPSGRAELVALVERLERLFDVGYDVVDVIFASAAADQPSLPPEQRGERSR